MSIVGSKLFSSLRRWEKKEADGIIYMSLRPESMCETVRLCDTVEDYDAWDHFVFNLPRAHYFQTYGWLKSYEFMGFMPHVLVQESNGMITNGVAFLMRRSHCFLGGS